MKVLYCHNYYQQRGGEDICFEADVEMLRQKGHEVETYVRHNDDIRQDSYVKIAINTLWSRQSEKEVDALISSFKPDILHCNNLFPQISPSIYRVANRRQVPIVQALHNYRAFCANSFFYRDEAVCTECHQSSTRLAGIRYRCYRDSYAATAVVTGMQFLHHSLGTYRNAVDMYFTPSAFTRKIYIEGGFDADSIDIKPNFIDPDPGIGKGDGKYILFVGRLSSEKGIETLLEAWNSGSIQTDLKVVGDGPLSSLFDLPSTNIQWLGRRTLDEVLELVGRATALVMPSQWYETFGRTIAESFSRGTPVIVSDLGAMAELVQDDVNGFLFRSGDVNDLVEKVNQLINGNPERLRPAARDSYIRNYTVDAGYDASIRIYQRAIERRKLRKTKQNGLL